jgi:hypothetical protein
VVFAPRELDMARLVSVLDSTSARMHQFTASRETHRDVI